jgi:hypothetical protein
VRHSRIVRVDWIKVISNSAGRLAVELYGTYFCPVRQIGTYILRDYPYLDLFIALESIPQVLTVEEERKIHFLEKGIIAISNNRY